MNRWYKSVPVQKKNEICCNENPYFFCCSFRKIKAKEGKVERDDAAGPTSNV